MKVRNKVKVDQCGKGGCGGGGGGNRKTDVRRLRWMEARRRGENERRRRPGYAWGGVVPRGLGRATLRCPNDRRDPPARSQSSPCVASRLSDA